MRTSPLKRAALLLLALALLIPTVLVGCGTPATSAPATSPAATAGTATATKAPAATGAATATKAPATTGATGETITVTDQVGRTVEIPKDVQSVACAYGVATNLIVSLGASDKLVAMGFTSDFFNMVNPNLANVGTVGRGKVDMEAIAKLQPDLFVHKAMDTETLEAVQALGIPTIGISAESQEDISVVLTLLGQALSMEDEAAALLAYYDTLMQKAKDLTADIPEADKKTAIVMGSEIGKVADGTMLQSEMIETAGGINPAKDVPVTQTWAIVGTEELFGWDPDFIFVTSSTTNEYTPEEILNDAAWANVSAVKSGNVTLVPSVLDSWEFPGVGSALGALWMISEMYPDKLSEADFNAIVAEFYKTVYNIEVTPEILGY